MVLATTMDHSSIRGLGTGITSLPRGAASGLITGIITRMPTTKTAEDSPHRSRASRSRFGVERLGGVDRLMILLCDGPMRGIDSSRDFHLSGNIPNEAGELASDGY